jgi:hypothetical protein
MKFLCEACRANLMSDPEHALQFWNKAWCLASLHSEALQWDNAITAYGNALEAAEVLLNQKHNIKYDLERYIRTAQEMTYAIRKGGYFDDMDALAILVEARLAQEKLARPLTWYLRPLKDVANNPICAVDMWMRTLKERLLPFTTQALH